MSPYDGWTLRHGSESSSLSAVSSTLLLASCVLSKLAFQWLSPKVEFPCDLQVRSTYHLSGAMLRCGDPGVGTPSLPFQWPFRLTGEILKKTSNS
jgi:hypothetical protein